MFSSFLHHYFNFILTISFIFLILNKLEFNSHCNFSLKLSFLINILFFLLIMILLSIKYSSSWMMFVTFINLLLHYRHIYCNFTLLINHIYSSILTDFSSIIFVSKKFRINSFINFKYFNKDLLVSLSLWVKCYSDFI